MYKVEIPADTVERAAIARRQQLDADRKRRIFDPKLRVLGVGVAGAVRGREVAKRVWRSIAPSPRLLPQACQRFALMLILGADALHDQYRDAPPPPPPAD